MTPSVPPHAEEPTESARIAGLDAAGVPAPTLTILWHPDPQRLGEQCALSVDDDTPIPISRFAPGFSAPGALGGRPLEHASVSRTPIHLLASRDGSVQLSLPAGPVCHEVDGLPTSGELLLTREQVANGVVLSLRGRVLLHLRHRTALPDRLSGPLLGVSGAMARVRRQIAQAASTELPVLVLGESGTGKELVAQEIHALGGRAGRPLCTVNMAALTESIATTELFGCVKGAFTGADAARRGLWAEADGATLFMDEVGDTPALVQPMLLRAVETGQYRPVGSSRVERADVRLIAATDRPLQERGFNVPLLRRLAAFVIRMPALRERREDLGVLLRREFEEAGDVAGWLGEVPPELARALCLHDWPGNVRQLRHAVQRLVLAAQDRQWLGVEDLLSLPPASSAARAAGNDLPPPAESAPAPFTDDEPQDPPRTGWRAPSSVTPDELLKALEQQAWSLRATAASLGISRSSLYALIDRHPLIRWPEDIAGDEIAAAVSEAPAGDVAALASNLRTPREALRRRLASLGISH
ncbi:MAG: sigma 54-interacting transcriptional regulator [Roseateles sp.]|uniref:sigma 54-interacting transcriptional regulator n=1 Tax=Roseateles sp. TaxID=1971397 RepID=UPI00403698E2